MRTIARFAMLGLMLAATALAHSSNPIVEENLLPGTSEWIIPPENREFARGQRLAGYASHTSVAPGETIRLYVQSTDVGHTLTIYRIGWYGGLGAREMARYHREGTYEQSVCPANPPTYMVECDWQDPFHLLIPSDWVSGYYLVKLTADGTGVENYMIFVVRDETRSAEHLMVSAVTTYQAYNRYEGKSLYRPRDGTQSRKVSFNRPYGTPEPQHTGVGQFFEWEIQMVRWLERHGYDVSYATSIDLHERLDLLLRHRHFLSVGHDEYYSWEMREAVELARSSCVNLGFFSANSIFWQVRFEPSSSGQPNRTMVGYRGLAPTEDPIATDGDDSNDYLITMLWRDGLPSSDEDEPSTRLPRPEDALIGVMYAFWPADDDLVLDAPGHPLLAGVTDAVLPGLVGYEGDRMFGNAPSSIQRIAHSPVAPRTIDGRSHYDCNVAGDDCFSDMTFYTAPSGAQVFATGTIQWSWGLDDFRPPGDDRPLLAHPAAEQITHNVLASFAQNPCGVDPSIQIPTPRYPHVELFFPDLGADVTVRIRECLVNPERCWLAEHRLSADWQLVQIYDRSAMRETDPKPIEVPEPDQITLLGSLIEVQSSGEQPGPARVTLRYDDGLTVPNRERQLRMAYLPLGDPAAGWQLAEVSSDPELNAIRATLPVPAVLSLALQELTIAIDVKPGSEENTINLKSAGVVPVAVLGSASFSTTDVDPFSLSLSGSSVGVRGRGDKAQCHQADVNQDGFVDLVCQMENLSMVETTDGGAIATLDGRLTDGTVFSGSDTLRIVP